MKKIFKIIFCNIILFISLLFISDVCIYGYNATIYEKTHNSVYIMPPFGYVIKPNYGLNNFDYFTGESNVYRGRKPDGTEFSDSKPIVLFGCSYAHGQFLDYNQTLSYKLSQILKRPVYNRGIPGRGLQHMYMQVTSDKFFNDVPDTDEYIYLFLDDHFRRMMIYFIDISDKHCNGHYSIKNGKPVLDNENNILMNILKSSYTFRILNYKYVQKYLENPKNANKITDTALVYLIESRKELEQRLNHKINFTVFIYDNYPFRYQSLFVDKLKKNDFRVIQLSELSDEDFNSPTYMMQENMHPSEQTWDLSAPKIAEYFKN